MIFEVRTPEQQAGDLGRKLAIEFIRLNFLDRPRFLELTNGGKLPRAEILEGAAGYLSYAAARERKRQGSDS